MGKKTRIVAIGGMPASGKTTLIRNIITQLGQYETKKITFDQEHECELLVFEEKKVCIAGRYSLEGWFAGTDAEKIRAEDLLSTANYCAENGYVLLYEGDRWFSKKAFDLVMDAGHEIAPLILEVDEKRLFWRHKHRGDKQSYEMLEQKRQRYSALRLWMTITKLGYIVDNGSLDSITKNTKVIIELCNQLQS